MQRQVAQKPDVNQIILYGEIWSDADAPHVRR
jgi:hypothetical protein